jgi:choice-of-anchor C domain-containing protein
MKTLKSALLVAALLTSGSAFAATNLIQNGDFESSDLSSLTEVTNSSGTYWTVNAGLHNLSDWTVGGTSIDLIKNGYGVIDGLSVDLAGSPGPGSISQSFDMIAGYTYILTFDMSSNGNNQADVTFGELLAETFTVNTIPTTFTRSFVASSDNTTSLTFASVGGKTNSGAVIDNVSVIAVPEPETYALMLAGLGLVGFLARRRKPIVA